MIGPYDDADLYDIEYADHTEDIAFYVDRARASGGLPRRTSSLARVLELGCGTGRLTVPIARTGVEVVGIDRAPAMLYTLRHKLLREPIDVQHRVSLIEDSYPSEAITGLFDAVLWPFNALHHCPDVDGLCRVLSAARGWLAPGALMSLDAYLPDRELYDRDPEGRYEQRVFADPRSGIPIESWEQGWWDESAQLHHVIYVYRWPDGTERRTHLQLRMFSRAEIYGAVEQAGLCMLREGQDFRFSPLHPRSLKWVAILGARR